MCTGSKVEGSGIWMQIKQLSSSQQGRNVGPCLIYLLDDIERAMGDWMEANQIELHLPDEIKGMSMECGHPLGDTRGRFLQRCNSLVGLFC